MRKVLFAVLIISVLFTGCRKPYDEPEYVEISPSQTAYLVPLDGDTKNNQAKMDSMEFLQDAKVATKRIRINHRWNQTGRRSWMGEWISSERLIIVERRPETREWTSDPQSGTSSKNQAVETESKGSIGFIIGLSVTAQINEEDATNFLYRYNNKPLSQIMDEEIRNTIESRFNEACSKLELSEIMAGKAQILQGVREIAIPYFKKKGITITNIGYKGQFSYSDKNIQTAINEQFIAEKERLAQEKRNQMKVEKAEAEAKAIKIRASTIKSQIKFKELDLREDWISKWDGKLPQYMLGENQSMLMNVK